MILQRSLGNVCAAGHDPEFDNYCDSLASSVCAPGDMSPGCVMRQIGPNNVVNLRKASTDWTKIAMYAGAAFLGVLLLRRR